MALASLKCFLFSCFSMVHCCTVPCTPVCLEAVCLFTLILLKRYLRGKKTSWIFLQVSCSWMLPCTKAHLPQWALNFIFVWFILRFFYPSLLLLLQLIHSGVYSNRKLQRKNEWQTCSRRQQRVIILLYVYSFLYRFNPSHVQQKKRNNSFLETPGLISVARLNVFPWVDKLSDKRIITELPNLFW